MPFPLKQAYLLLLILDNSSFCSFLRVLHHKASILRVRTLLSHIPFCNESSNSNCIKQSSIILLGGWCKYGAPVTGSLISVSLMMQVWQVTLDTMEEHVPIGHDVRTVPSGMKPFPQGMVTQQHDKKRCQNLKNTTLSISFYLSFFRCIQNNHRSQ